MCKINFTVQFRAKAFLFIFCYGTLFLFIFARRHQKDLEHLKVESFNLPLGAPNQFSHFFQFKLREPFRPRFNCSAESRSNKQPKRIKTSKEIINVPHRMCQPQSSTSTIQISLLLLNMWKKVEFRKSERSGSNQEIFSEYCPDLLGAGSYAKQFHILQANSSLLMCEDAWDEVLSITHALTID